MIGDILQSRFGWFFRDNGDGTFASLSNPTSHIDGVFTYSTVTEVEDPMVLVRDGQLTGDGDRLAARVAMTLNARFTTA
jgi:hypothetical protein